MLHTGKVGFVTKRIECSGRVIAYGVCSVGGWAAFQTFLPWLQKIWLIWSLGDVGNTVSFLGGPCRHEEECRGCCCTLLRPRSALISHGSMLLSDQGAQQWLCLPSSGARFQPLYSSCRSHRFLEAHVPLCVLPSDQGRSPGFVPHSNTWQ